MNYTSELPERIVETCPGPCRKAIRSGVVRTITQQYEQGSQSDVSRRGTLKITGRVGITRFIERGGCEGVFCG